MPNPASLHHWEIELNNSLAIPISFNVAIFSFGGPLPITGIMLPPGDSVYWDIHYPDIPEFGGAYSFFAANPVGSGGTGLTLDRSVVEFAAGAGPGPAGPLFTGGGGVIGVLPGVPPITLAVTPEPSAIALAGSGLAALYLMRRRRKRTA